MKYDRAEKNKKKRRIRRKYCDTKRTGAVRNKRKIEGTKRKKEK